MYLIGVDDAGRGPLIGDMILAGVLIKKDDEPKLRKIGAKDSKLLEHSARVKISKLIREMVVDSKLVHATPNEIDHAVLSGANLNTLEAMKMAEVINGLNDKKKEIKVIVDCPSVNTVKWKEKLLSFIKHPQNLTIVCEHKADFNHPVVSAASILAKVEREEEVARLKKEYSSYGNLGSGYPADPVTKEFLKNHGKALADSGIFRKSWATWKELFGAENAKKKGQRSLGDF